ncbi:ArsR/SmtB family transcription factor [Maledivibacter halophilus]|uniref:DNA-binding transcriptional regulator, ArsR family n=1 Tax=Maledivibacter halophilus TaxID=36842 RepID=A0A1T5IJI3_9FIRM|nr:metalloregulator ArsR/SmtB family transcription factor [Maledivibacter halophilus]SKC39336.1 DNA-binding transcriptional regulator, ArsR family [Maledivibacter halophilus]
MPIIEKTYDINNHIKFYCSPIVEMVASLHVLADARHHINCFNWANEVKQKLNHGEKSEIEYFAIHYNQWAFIMDIMTEIASEDNDDVYKDLETIKNMKHIDFAYLFLGFSAMYYDKKILIDWIAEPEKLTEKDINMLGNYLSLSDIKYFLKNIDLLRNKLIYVLEMYWEKVFKKEWFIIKKYIIKTIKDQKMILVNTNVFNYISNLHHDISINNNSIIMKKNIDFKINIDDIKEIRLFPSVFTSPHLMINIVHNSLILYLNLNFHSAMLSEKVPDELITLLKAVSDETRLKIIRILSSNQATTQELSEILNLTPSTISLHLKSMKEAKLVKTKKVKKFVYYKLIENQLNSINDRLKDFLKL